MLFVDIEKRIGTFSLRIHLETARGVLSLLGASGSGKSMTLKCIAGIESPDSGRIVLNDQVLFDSKQGIDLPPQKRKVGYLFQQYALFPNMTVRQNIEAALYHLPKKERSTIVDQKLQEFRLEGLARQKPGELSGGEQQRTALARMLANVPDLLLLDEPFSALDNHLKRQLMLELQQVLKSYDKDVILVTHSIDEVLGLADTMCVLTDGRSEPVRKVSEVKKNPLTVSAARLFGCRNFSKAELTEDGLVYCTDWNVKFKIGSIDEQNFMVGIYPQDVILYRGADRSRNATQNTVDCTVSQILQTEHGKENILKIAGTEAYLCALLPDEDIIAVGEQVTAFLAPDKLLLLSLQL